jgi:hypothetical protein
LAAGEEESVSLGRFQNRNILKMDNFRKYGVEDGSNAQVAADSYFEKPFEVGTYLSVAEQIMETYRLSRGSAVGAVA